MADFGSINGKLTANNEEVVTVSNKGLCTAWVNFDGVTETIRDSYNISGIVKTATGTFNISFDSMDNSNYSVSGSHNEVNSSISSTRIKTFLSSGFTINTYIGTGLVDPAIVSIQVFGGKD